MRLFMVVGLAFSVVAAADCHYVSQDGKQWTNEKSFCFEVGEKLTVKVMEKEKELFQGEYVLEKFECDAAKDWCDEVNWLATPAAVFPEPAEWPEFPVLQWLPANYGFTLHYLNVGNEVTGQLIVYDTDVAKSLVFCSVDPQSEAGSLCRTKVFQD